MSSITKKQIVALTGLMLIVFVIAHLAGNLFIYGGAQAFNAYADKLDHLRPLLNVGEYTLLAVFLIHIWFTGLLIGDNIKARGGFNRYAVEKPVGNRSIATKLMPYTGTYILLFVVWHLFDFTFTDHLGARAYIGGTNYGLYGIVVNAFKDPVHSLLYIVAMCCLGLHLAHGTESTVQTFGLNNTKFIQKASRYFAAAMVIGYSSIPVYVMYFLK
jgi:succinate dehydrogenase / fumarate reductase, cytochrome b subunit